MNPAQRVAEIDALLPQTQCTKCGYAGCEPYARAIAAGEADINRCPPGGAAGIAALATLLDRPAKALDTTRGVERPHQVARIDESRCIGCTLCIQACPVDAIAGAPKQMHSVIAALCSGCDLCVAPCPVDCIDMIPAANAWDRAAADAARNRFYRRRARLERDRAAREARRNRAVAAQDDEAQARQAFIRAAMERARARRAAAVPEGK
ncbi:MAG TPA: RnfABCDGE type electron transport complex subunit B [Burkholderiales bacterium]|nr:RnfABCDGE type electron transport complex subunit B [Burkholderiales bacterium]